MITTLKELREEGYRGVKVGGYTPGTDPNATEEEVVAALMDAIDQLHEDAENGTLEFINHFDD